ncbi:hypothetical protein LUZ60_013325 [Juncus effusus]|nr:hypothetical protein LUZ60_013325 [Juncus effusus]
MDYYKVLEVDRDATMEEIKTAFKQLAFRWHPDKNLNNVDLAEEKFKQISEAYKVLKDPQKRAEYDFHKRKSNGRSNHSPSAFNTDESSSSSSSSSNQFAYGSFSDSLFKTFFGRGPAVKAAPIEYYVNCTLEELYAGTVKSIILTRDVLDRRGKPIPIKEMLTVNIKPGSKNGAKFIFEKKGSERANTIPADIIVILNQKPHNLFTREGDDLILKETISLFEVLTCSCGAEFKTLDGRNLKVPINFLGFPFCEKVVKGEGMPLANDPSKRGDLRIRLNVRLF